MIGKIAKAVLKLILPDVTEHLMRVFKMDKLVSYMELPNEADRGVLKLQDELNMVKAELKGLNALKEEIKSMSKILNKLKNKKIFKSLG